VIGQNCVNPLGFLQRTVEGRIIASCEAKVVLRVGCGVMGRFTLRGHTDVVLIVKVVIKSSQVSGSEPVQCEIFLPDTPCHGPLVAFSVEISFYIHLSR
jgi:hypothetical protein